MYNPQGDVIGLFDDELNVVVEYTYDSWGKILSITGPLQYSLGRTNPFRYRGYYYDNESGMYYLNSRYYHPEIGRFINADGLVQTGQGILDKNMFAYCANNPIIFCDPSGCSYTITMPAVGDGPIYITSDESLTFYFSSTSSTPHNSNPSYGEGMSFINDLVSLGVQLGVDLSRHDVTSQIKPNNISSVTFAKNINSNLKYIDDFSRVSTKALNITGCICIAIGVTENAIINCQNGESWEKIVWDMAIDTIYMSGSAYVSAKLGASIGGAIGSTVPVVGTAAGVIIGMGFGVAIDYCLQETITGVKSWL